MAHTHFPRGDIRRIFSAPMRWPLLDLRRCAPELVAPLDIYIPSIKIGIQFALSAVLFSFVLIRIELATLAARRRLGSVGPASGVRCRPPGSSGARSKGDGGERVRQLLARWRRRECFRGNIYSSSLEANQECNWSCFWFKGVVSTRRNRVHTFSPVSFSPPMKGGISLMLCQTDGWLLLQLHPCISTYELYKISARHFS